MEISPQDVQEALVSNAIRLIDVRGEDEWNTARIKGFTNVKSMAGGIDAWSLTVDPNIPRY